MGGWIATLLAEQRPSQVAALLGIAAAPDFTEELIWNSLDADAQARLHRGDVVERANRYEPESPRMLSMHFIESGRRCLILDKQLKWRGPVRLLHGTHDEDVPASLSQRLLEKLNSNDARLILVKGADHRFSTPALLSLLAEQLCELHSCVG